VNLQIAKGQPSKILRAYAADYNQFVEPLRDRDSACWTATNSVGSSNHLSGTALDLNWDSHPFQVADAGYSREMIRTMREILDFYEDTVFWANDWNSPKDAMHHQMGYDTYGNPKTQSFIDRKIRSDGFSTFRRGPIQAQTMNVPPAGAPAPAASGDLLKLVQDIHREIFTPRPSQSIYATPGEGAIWKPFDTLASVDAMRHEEDVETTARRGNLPALDLIVQVANGRGQRTDPYAVGRARRFVQELERERPEVLRMYIEAKAAQQ
jgi:putative chitinase